MPESETWVVSTHPGCPWQYFLLFQHCCVILESTQSLKLGSSQHTPVASGNICYWSNTVQHICSTYSCTSIIKAFYIKHRGTCNLNPEKTDQNTKNLQKNEHKGPHYVTLALFSYYKNQGENLPD